MEDFGDVEKWIEILKDCKQLSEADVKKLTDKVLFLLSLFKKLLIVSILYYFLFLIS